LSRIKGRGSVCCTGWAHVRRRQQAARVHIGVFMGGQTRMGGEKVAGVVKGWWGAKSGVGDRRDTGHRRVVPGGTGLWHTCCLVVWRCFRYGPRRRRVPIWRRAGLSSNRGWMDAGRAQKIAPDRVAGRLLG
jgi:hypothetical protein